MSFRCFRGSFLQVRSGSPPGRSERRSAALAQAQMPTSVLKTV
jgi:hypothetical protein